ncbi:MAG: hypothetical protein NTY11_00690 [Candidatus Parcubacteria bacterium]|nr:hypothetical protein [Candidatus Parcubacteria bacterium]
MNKKIIKVFKYVFFVLLAIIIIIVGIFAFWKIKAYVVYQEAARNANISTIYSKETNGISNEKIIQAARNYIQQKPLVSNVSWNIKEVSWAEYLGDGAVNWLLRHAPENITYTENLTLGMNEYSKNRYMIYWRYMSGCEKVKTQWGGEIWVSRLGIGCVGGEAITVVLNPDLSPYLIDVGLLY